MAETGAKAHARRTDPATSHAAAASVRNLRDSQRAILAMFARFGPMCDERLVQLYPHNPHPQQSESGIRTRRRELVDLGHLQDTGRRQKMRTGRQAIIWGIPSDTDPPAAGSVSDGTDPTSETVPSETSGPPDSLPLTPPGGPEQRGVADASAGDTPRIAAAQPEQLTLTEEQT